MSNRDYLITYFNLETDTTDQLRFHTLKELHDWFNGMDCGITITAIDEIPGRASLNKYYKGGQK